MTQAADWPYNPRIAGPRTYRTYALGDDVAGVMAIPAGEIVISITAYADAGAAAPSVQIGALTPSGFPAGGAIELDPPTDPRNNDAGTLVGPVNITFTDCSDWTIEVLA